jgi:hypothetical protein
MRPGDPIGDLWVALVGRKRRDRADQGSAAVHDGTVVDARVGQDAFEVGVEGRPVTDEGHTLTRRVRQLIHTDEDRLLRRLAVTEQAQLRDLLTRALDPDTL